MDRARELYDTVVDSDNGHAPFTPFTPNGLPSVSEFPVSALPKACMRLVNEGAKSIGCPPEFVALPVLVTLGSAIGNARRLLVKRGWTEGAAIFAAAIAGPGSGKSPAQNLATAPATREQARLRKEYREQREQHEQRLREHKVEAKEAQRQGEAEPEPPVEPTMERTSVGDTTVEALAQILDENPRGVLIIRDELSGWVRGMDQYKGGKGSDRQFYLSGWSNEVAQFDRKSQGEPVFIERPFYGIYGSIQPDVVNDLRGGREDGMLERFLYAYPDTVISDWTSNEVSEEAQDEYAALYRNLRELLLMVRDENGDLQPQLVRFTDEALALFKQAFDDQQAERRSPGFPGAMNYVYPKFTSYLARLSLMIAMCRAVGEDRPNYAVQLGDVTRAVLLIQFFKSHARRVYAAIHGEDSNELLAYDVAVFLAQRGGVFEGTPADLFKQLQSKYKPGNASWLTKKLKDLDGIRVEEGHRSVRSEATETGRSSERFLKLGLENGVNGVNAMCAWREE